MTIVKAEYGDLPDGNKTDAEDAEAELAAMRTLLAPGGSIVVQVPNAACWQARLNASSWS